MIQMEFLMGKWKQIITYFLVVEGKLQQCNPYPDGMNHVENNEGRTHMPLVSMTDMLNKAKAEGYAVGQFNVNNLEFAQAILQAAEQEKSPVILGVSEGAGRYMSGFKTVVKMVEGLLEDLNVTVPVAIHLDHG